MERVEMEEDGREVRRKGGMRVDNRNRRWNRRNE